MVLSIEQLKQIEPRRYCSECDKTKPISQFPQIERGLRNKPGKICIECAEKHKLPKIEAEILGVSESKPLLKDLNRVKRAVEVDEDESRTKECVECREFKELEEFDSSPKICEECVEELEEKERLVSIHKHVEKTSKSEIKKIESKFCTRCNTEKPVSDFYKKVGASGNKVSDYEMPCKKCKTEKGKIYRDKRKEKESGKNPADKNLQPKESTEKRALELLNGYPTFFKRQKITVKLLIGKFGFAKSTAANYMKVLVDKGFLREQGKGNGRSWSYVEDKPIEFEGPKDMPVETQARMNEPCMPGNLIEENIFDKNKLKSRSDIDKDSKTFTNHGEQIMKDKDIANIMNVNNMMGVNKTQQDRIMDLIDIAYSGAESIQINPQTHEINIKMKVV
jgi:hypothetical protein